MADNHINVNRSLAVGFECGRVADLGAQLRHHLSQLKSVIDAMDDGAARASITNATGVPPEKTADFVFLLANAKTAFDNAAALNQFIDYLGGLTG